MSTSSRLRRASGAERRLGQALCAPVLRRPHVSTGMSAKRLGVALLGAATALGASVVPAAADWTPYHFDNTHNGYDASAPAFGAVAPNWTTVSGAINGDILAEPLYSAGIVYVVTMHN